MARIRQLSKNLINQIAAGEVIERPASVVKELVENSIDAGANRIEIVVSNGCRDIRIADNGSGIHPDDIELAFVKHATSKLTDEESLFNIHTLGFRGEALASIISIAKVTCTTRTKDFDYGIKVNSENSIINSAKVGCAIGTVMEVRELFFNQPARLKFLKSEKTEFAYIQELVQALAIANPSVAFILKNGSFNVINTAIGGDLLSVITQLYSNDIVNELREVNKTDDISKMRIKGFISLPTYTRSSKKSIYTFVNSRIVKCPVIMKATDVAYKNMLPSGRFPFVVLNLDIDSEYIDINVHPQKREIRYKNTNQIFNFVQSAISSALNAVEREKQSFISDTKSADVIPIVKPPLFTEDTTSTSTGHNFIFPLNMTVTDGKPEIKTIKPKQEKFDINTSVSSTQNNINIVGQFKNTYILVENDDNLEIIDQHIAEERYIYEKLKNEKEVASQLLIISDVYDLEPSDVDLLENSKEQLEKFGYRIDKVSQTQIIFKKIPQVLSKVKLSEVLSELLMNLKNSPENDLDTKEEKILITTSCKAAIKAGDKLNQWQMEEIVKNLRSVKNPYTCPHGRTISHFIPLKEIASYFSRNV